MDVGDEGQVEFGPVPGWRRPGGTNKMYLFFCVLFSFVSSFLLCPLFFCVLFSFVSSFLFLCLADMGGRSMGCLTMTAQACPG